MNNICFPVQRRAFVSRVFHFFEISPNFILLLAYMFWHALANRSVDTVEGVCNGFLPYTRFLGFLEFSGYHQWQQESQ